MMSRQTSRAVGVPAGFVIAVATAIAMFVITMTQGFTMALGVAIFVAALYWSFTSEHGAVYCLILAALLEGIYKCLTPNMLTMLLKDIFLLILMLRLFWISQRNRDFKWMHQPFTGAAICFVVYCLALMFSPTTRSGLLALAGLRTWLLWMPVYFPLYQYFSSRAKTVRFIALLLIIHLPVSVYGIVQGNIGYEHTRILPKFHQITQFFQSDYSAPLTERGATDSSESFEANFKAIMNVRACAIHISPGTFGAACALLILLSLAYVGFTTSGPGRTWAIISALAATGGLLASGSRAPVFGLAAGLLAMILVARRRTVLIAAVVLIALVAVFFLRDWVGGGAARMENRISLAIAVERAMYPLRIGLQQGLARPFGGGIASGTGMGRLFYRAGLQTAEGTRWVENEFGRALTELGFLGTALWLYMITSILWVCGRAIRRMGAHPDALLAAGMFGGMVATYLQLSTGSALYSAHGGLYYWIFAAAIVKLAQFAGARSEGKTDDEAEHVLKPTGSLGPAAGVWRQPGQRLGLPRMAPVPPARPPLRGPGYRRAPNAPPDGPPAPPEQRAEP